MKNSLHLACLLTLFVLGVSVGFAKKPKPPADVVVVADALSDSTINVTPEPGKPVYYLILGAIEHAIGPTHAGEPPVDEKFIRAELVKALASQGYLETGMGRPLPQLVLVVRWGQATLEKDMNQENEIDLEKSRDLNNPASPFNYNEMSRLVGAYKLRAGGALPSLEESDLDDTLRSDRYYIFVGALDAAALRQKRKMLVWRTYMSIDGHREYMVNNISHMIADAAPYFGHEEKMPVVVNNKVRSASVQMGELKVIESDVPDTTKEPQKK